MMSHEEEVQLLSRVEILEPLSEEDLRGLLRQSLDTHLKAGETFFTPEDTSERLFILIKEECGYSDNRTCGSLRLLK